MESFFMWFGIVCAFLLCFAAAQVAAALYTNVKHESYYDGIRRQIMFTFKELHTYFDIDQKPMIPVEEVAKMLMLLHDRQFPNISQLASDERYKRITFAEEHRNRALLVNYPLGTKVILRTNEPGPLIIGDVVEHVWHENSGCYNAICIQDEKGEKHYTLDTSPMYYDDDLLAALNKLTWWEQWNIVARGISVIDEKEAQRKEAYTAEKEKV